MNRSITRISIVLLFLLGLAIQVPAYPAQAQDNSPTETLAPTASQTPEATAVVKAKKSPTPKPPTPTVPAEVSRPLVVIELTEYGSAVAAGETFNLVVHLKNRGSQRAYNLTAVFQSADLFPLDTGGVKTLSPLAPGRGSDVVQPLIASDGLSAGVSTVTVNLSYAGEDGAPFTETFTIAISTKETVYSGLVASVTPTPTGTAQPRPQLVIGGYQASVDPLQPGTIFNLDLEVRNLGNSDAQAVTMVLGGSGASVDVSSGTPQPGGVSGGSSDLTNFAPLGTSNLFYMGDIPSGAVYRSTTQLIVNVTTNPGAYPLKISYVYTDGHGGRFVDDQVITLLVYSLPQVEVGYYRDPGVFFAGQPNQIPLQVTNLGRFTSVLGSLKITSPASEVTNNVSLVGNLEPGGYFTMDAMVVPLQAGPLDLVVTINYTDNFNQPRSITQTLNVDVQAGGPGMGPDGQGIDGQGMVPGMEGMPGKPGLGLEGIPGDGSGLPGDGIAAQPETFWQKAVRFVKGLVGLNSAQEQPGLTVPAGMPGELDPGASVPLKGEGKH